MSKQSLSADDREPRLHDSVRIGAEGLAKVLGDLEARILSAAWAIGRPATGR